MTILNILGYTICDSFVMRKYYKLKSMNCKLIRKKITTYIFLSCLCYFVSILHLHVILR